MRPSLVFLLACLIFAGLWTAFKLPATLFPNIPFPRIVVTVESGDTPADRMVIEVTQPLEEVLRSIPDVRSVRSTSNRGTAEISLEFRENKDRVASLLQVQAAINQLLPTLPPGTLFNAQNMGPNLFPVLGLSLTANKHSAIDLYDFAYFQLRPQLLTIPGVSHIEIVGGQQAEFQVLIDPAKLRAKNLTLEEVATVLATNNIVTTVGRIEDYYQLYLILSDARLRQLNEIRQIVLRSSGTSIIKLEDIAKIIPGEKPQSTRVTANGQNAVLVNIVQQAGADTIAITENFKKQWAEFQKYIPPDIKITPYYDQSELIQASMNNVKHIVIAGTLLTAIILMLFLHTRRTAVILTLLLPGVLAITVLLLSMFKMSFNIMTLGGMVAGAVFIIADGIVLIENNMQQRREILKFLAVSSLTTIVIFLPFAFLDGITGGFFKTLALTIASALIILFFFTCLLAPQFRETPVSSPRWLVSLSHYYHRYAILFLKTPKYLAISIIIILCAGYLSYAQTEISFMPHMDEDSFVLDYQTSPGTSLSETDRLLKQAEKLIIALPELDNYSRRTGVQLGGGLTEANTGDFLIRLKKHPRRPIDQIMATLQQQIQSQVPGLTVKTLQITEALIETLTAAPEPIEIKIWGTNQARLQQVAKEVASLLSSIPGVIDVSNGITTAGDTIDVKVDRVKAALLGLDTDSITRQLKTQLTGNVISWVQMGGKLVGIRLWTPEGLHHRLQQLEGLPLRTSTGHYISLKHVAKLSIQPGEAAITRENLKSMVVVTAGTKNRHLGTVMQDVKKTIQTLSLPPGTYIEYGGLYKDQKKTFYDFLKILIGILLLITFLLLFLYENFRIVLSILSTLLLAIPSIFIGLWLTQTELNISSMIGILTVIGITTKIAIFYFKEVISTSIICLKLILMTSLIIVGMLLPWIQQPLAIAIISGIICTLPVVLFIMPAAYLFLNKHT